MNDSMQLSKSTSLKRVYSDGDLFLIQNDVNKKYYPEIVYLSYDMLLIGGKI